jgi:membrane protease YdiL (CAAX protease family)
MRLLKQFVAVALIAFVGGQVVANLHNPWLTLGVGTATAVLAIFLYRWVVRRTEHRSPTELGGSGAVGRLTGGILIGFAMFAVVAVNIAFNGSLHIAGIGSVPGAFGLFGFMAAAATTEELLFRGVLFRIVEERAGTWLALLLTGVVFGAMHLANPDATVQGAGAIAIEAGFMLAACYAAVRSLWVTIGLHFGWNFALGGIFSLAVSGNGTSKGLLDVAISGPRLYTGGAFGPELGVATVGTGVLLTLIFLAIAYRRGTIVPFGGRAEEADRQHTTERESIS